MSSLSILALALIQALALLALAPLFSGISRVLRAKIHSRSGPDIFQDYRDIFKLLRRQNISPAASGVFFQMMPYVMVGTMLTIATALPIVTVISPLSPIGDLITVVYLFAVARFFFAIAGLDTGSTFTGIGASRESMLGILVEPILMLGLWVAALLAGSTNLGVMSFHVLNWDVNSSLALVLALLACAFATFIEMGKLPFDMAEAEQELQEGPLTEYSGSAFAVLKLGISLKQLVVLQLFIGVFVPWGQMATFSAGALVLAIVIAFIKLLVGIALIALFENSVARLRFLKTSYTTWAGFGLAAMAFLSWLIA
ncbi:respiratory chain complex I subunit 1 family protein [Obesumbacterium proteus]|uniref:respiratory chain complex I subunit 1 family protein n=1 Tax=Obesumbacterium proteus TaxID=82983 RepID=UPI000622505A|nr:respiratory chain complex I subunit 1 family protein [Obesumbacterium proteus]KKI47514.1 hydrogenase 3 membrane subunit [Obesumbacterium proteus]MCE9883337.1 respiratory chain complex I subunit 1 family protein [Obesumbacterium proteus]MCE9915525.1 respiratory chain complex I subunit 1 family protein [Obesumbacterium proteus]MCE9928999.1 respiratory chain complex I subunit 1 family protein [Obesumbacterium proteus]MCG2877386.1 respiratory chain complex I subunit 1 family protein [Obesumbact